MNQFIFTILGAEGSGQSSNTNVQPGSREPVRLPLPVERRPPILPFIEIQSENTVSLYMIDNSEFQGVLKFYGHQVYPDWIHKPLYDKIMIYVLQPDGYSWITEIKTDRSPAEPISVIVALPVGTRLVASLKVFNRGQLLIVKPHNREKTHAFVTMPNGICYTGYLK